jgi:hypothetical protein
MKWAGQMNWVRRMNLLYAQRVVAGYAALAMREA